MRTGIRKWENVARDPKRVKITAPNSQRLQSYVRLKLASGIFDFKNGNHDFPSKISIFHRKPRFYLKIHRRVLNFLANFGCANNLKLIPKKVMPPTLDGSISATSRSWKENSVSRFAYSVSTFTWARF